MFRYIDSPSTISTRPKSQDLLLSTLIVTFALWRAFNWLARRTLRKPDSYTSTGMIDLKVAIMHAEPYLRSILGTVVTPFIDPDTKPPQRWRHTPVKYPHTVDVGCRGHTFQRQERKSCIFRTESRRVLVRRSSASTLTHLDDLVVQEICMFGSAPATWFSNACARCARYRMCSFRSL